MQFRKVFLFLIFLLLTIGCVSGVFAALSNDMNIIKDVSIGVWGIGSRDPITAIDNFGFKILGLAKIFISGLALIYLVMIGVYMVVFSENEERIKTQRKQIYYSLVGFFFLNIPGLLYQILFSTPKNHDALGDPPASGWSSILGWFFWDDTILNGFFNNLIGFFQVFVFGIAVLMFTWGLFRLILSAGDEEIQKKAKNRILYGTLALLFMGFVRFWGVIISSGDFSGKITKTAGSLFSLALLFAGPIAIFFLIWGGYYYITSAGDEERTKKWKGIILNTFVASLILLASYSFLTDLINFKL